MEGIAAEGSDQYLVPELQNTGWYLDYVEVGADEEPEEKYYGYLVESYTFVNPESEIGLACNIEEYANCYRNYEVYADEVGGSEEMYLYRNRKNWWSGIRDLMRKNPNEVIQE